MRFRFVVPAALALFVVLPALAQRPEEHNNIRQAQEHRDGPRANQGHVPQGPPPKRDNHAKPEVERHDSRVNSVPHVNNDHWFGHDRPNDKRYVVAHPFEHGRFEHIGASYRYNVLRIDRDHHRFWFPGGFYFEVASWDWGLCSDWCWDCGEDFTIYDDPDHPGYYLLYNIHTGGYVHVTYMGT